MTTYLMLGTYSLEALDAISKQRTDEAIELIEANGGKLRSGYALLGNVDVVLVVDLPDTERALATSAALSQLLGISFSTSPAVSLEEFDRLMA
jgi:uncharacterized protein with GYD domain